MIISRWMFLRIRSVSDKICREIKACTLSSKYFFWRLGRLRNNVEKYGRTRKATDDNIIQRMRFPCFITEDTNTHSEYIISIAFPQQQWLQERTSLLRYIDFASLVYATWKIIGEEWLVSTKLLYLNFYACFLDFLQRMNSLPLLVCAFY